MPGQEVSPVTLKETKSKQIDKVHKRKYYRIN